MVDTPFYWLQWSVKYTLGTSETNFMELHFLKYICIYKSNTYSLNMRRSYFYLKNVIVDI